MFSVRYFDSTRTQFVLLDQFIQGNGWIRRKTYMPLAPGMTIVDSKKNKKKKVLDRRVNTTTTSNNHGDNDSCIITPKLPKHKSQIGMAVQGRHAGFASRMIAFGFDLALVIGLFSLCIFILDRIIELAQASSNGGSTTNEEEYYFSLKEKWGYWMLLAQGMFAYVYFASGIVSSGKTVGKAIVGLKVVNTEDGTHVHVSRVLLRTLFVVADIFAFFGWITVDTHYRWFATWVILEIVVGLVRRGHKHIHDIIASTSVVYSWDAKLAHYRHELEVEESEQVRHTSMLGNFNHFGDDDEEPMGGTGLKTKMGGLLRRRTPTTTPNNDRTDRTRFWNKKKKKKNKRNTLSNKQEHDVPHHNVKFKNENNRHHDDLIDTTATATRIGSSSRVDNSLIHNMNEFLSARQAHPQNDDEDDKTDRSLAFLSARDTSMEEEGCGIRSRMADLPPLMTEDDEIMSSSSSFENRS